MGGSIWHKEKFLELINNVELCNYLEDKFEESSIGGSVFDFFISAMVVLCGGTIHKLECHKELWTDQVRSLDGIAILNQVKHYYSDQPLDMNTIY
jgi:hypothetical protein